MTSLVTFISLRSPITDDSWVSSLLSMKNLDNHCFYLSGGSLHPSVAGELDTRVSVLPPKLISLLETTYQSRILDSLSTISVDEIVSLSNTTLSPEMQVLVDLWVLVRSDVHLSEMGPSYSGIDATYATLLGLEVAAVMSGSFVDHWTSCHVKHICRPYDVYSCLANIHSGIESKP